MLPPNSGYAYLAPVMKQQAPMSGPIHIAAPPEAAGQRIDRFVADSIGTISRSRVKTLIEQARLTTGGRRITEPAEAGRDPRRAQYPRPSRGGACRRRLPARHPPRGARHAATAAHPLRHIVRRRG